MNELSKLSAAWHEVGEEGEGQRVDNYLMRLLKGVPKSHIYRILRSGEVRVNSARIRAEHRLQIGDRIRVPPIKVAHRTTSAPATPLPPQLDSRIIHEDDHLIALDKPSGTAVHGGSGISLGIIERIRRERPQARFLELVHRLDRDTSGVLLIAKRRSALTSLHAALREGRTRKLYLALVSGRWNARQQNVSLPLHKYVVASGERRVRVDPDGQPSQTIFRLREQWARFALLEAELRTGRTHQIRVHLAHLGFPIAGDDKYGDYELNKTLGRQGLKRMFLHAHTLSFEHPGTGERVTFEAPLPVELSAFLRLCTDDAASL